MAYYQELDNICSLSYYLDPLFPHKSADTDIDTQKLDDIHRWQYFYENLLSTKKQI